MDGCLCCHQIKEHNCFPSHCTFVSPGALNLLCADRSHIVTCVSSRILLRSAWSSLQGRLTWSLQAALPLKSECVRYGPVSPCARLKKYKGFWLGASHSTRVSEQAHSRVFFVVAAVSFMLTFLPERQKKKTGRLHHCLVLKIRTQYVVIFIVAPFPFSKRQYIIYLFHSD